jgi:hypothetical protein
MLSRSRRAVLFYSFFKAIMSNHEVKITPITGKEQATRYELTVTAETRIRYESYETLESALDSFDPSLTARVRSHVVEGVRGEAKAVIFCLEDSVERL